MTPFRRLVAIAGLCCASLLRAQSFVVDAANGPGTDFTSIAAAVQTVPDGAVLRIRAGAYAPFAIAGKGLRLLAEANVRVLQPLFGVGITISSLAANQTVVLHGLRVASANNTPAPVSLTCSNAQGAIVLDGLIPGQGGILALRATGCDRLFVRGGVGWRTMEFANSHAVVENCSVSGIGWVAVSLPTVTVANGTLQWVDSTVDGSVALNGTSVATIQLQQADLRLLGSSLVRNALGPFCIAGSGRVRLDPAVRVTLLNGGSGVGAIDPALAPLVKQMPVLTTAVTAASASASLVGRAGDLALVTVSLPGPRLAVAGFQDLFWIDTSVAGPLTFGVLGSTPFPAALPLPPGRLDGVRAMWQAVTWDQAADWQVSNPSVAVLNRP